MIKNLDKILLGIYLLGFFACGSDYYAERAYWNLSRKYNEVLKNPQKASEKEFNKTVDALHRLIIKYPNWSKSVELQFYLGEMYVYRKDIKNAVEELMKIIMNFPDEMNFCAKAQFSIGLLYEQQKDIKKALEEYKQIIDRYPTTNIGLQIPVYTYEFCNRNNMKEESERILKNTIRDYWTIIEKNPYSKVVPKIFDLLMFAYYQQGNREEIIKMLKNFADKYKDSDSAPVAMYKMAMYYRDVLKHSDKAIEIYNEIIKKYPSSKLEKEIEIEIANLSVKDGDLNKAHREYDKIIEKYPEDTNIQVASQFAIAVSYDKAGKWNEAEKEYKKLMTNYPETMQSLQVPLIIANHYKEAKQETEAKKYFNNALLRYINIIKKNPKSKIAIFAHELIANAYLMQDKWKEGLSVLTTIREKYPKDPVAAIALFKIASIYESGLKNNTKAIEIYNQFMREYPNHKLITEVKQTVNKLLSK